MRILFLNENWGLAGGQERYILSVGNGLVRRGHEVSLLYGRAAGRPTDASALQFSVRQVGGLEKEAVAKFAQDFKAEVINLQNVYDPDLINLLAQRFPTTRFVHDHTTYCPGNSKYFFNSQTTCPIAVSSLCLLNAHREKCMTRRPVQGLKRVGERLAWLKALRKLPLIMANSTYVKERLVQNGLDETKIKVNHLFPGHRIEVRENPNPLGSGGDPLILFVGRLFKEKGVDLLLRALSGVEAKFRLIVVGEGWEKDNLVNLASRLGLAPQVTFPGYQEGELLAQLYRSCSFLVLPSVWPEPFGMVGLEANSFGKPVIAFNVGGISDWLEDGVNGLLVSEISEDSLKKRITQLLENPDLTQRLGGGGIRKVANYFNLERHLDSLLNLYSRIS